MTYTLHHGDCLDVLRAMADCSVDAVVTDPPYGMNFQSNHVPDERKKKRIAGDERPFIWFLHEAYRVCADGGALFCFTDWKNQETWRIAIECAGFTIRSHVVWDRLNHGMGDLTGSFAPRHDCAWFASKGRFQFAGKRPVSVMRAMRVNSITTPHPTEKPVDLMTSIVEAVCPPDGVVLDPFMGTGSTGIAATSTGRRFIGIEREAEYVAIAEARIRAVVPTLFAAE